METTLQEAAIRGIGRGLMKLNGLYTPAEQRLTLLLPKCPACSYKAKLSDEGYVSDIPPIEKHLKAMEDALPERAKSSVRAMFRHAMLCSVFMSRLAMAAGDGTSQSSKRQH